MVSATAKPISGARNSKVIELRKIRLQNLEVLNSNLVTVLNLQQYLAYSLLVVENWAN